MDKVAERLRCARRRLKTAQGRATKAEETLRAARTKVREIERLIVDLGARQGSRSAGVRKNRAIATNVVMEPGKLEDDLRLIEAFDSGR